MAIRKAFEIELNGRTFTGATIPARSACLLLPRLVKMIGRGLNGIKGSESEGESDMVSLALSALGGVSGALDEKEIGSLLKDLLSGVVGTYQVNEEGATAFGDCWEKFDDIFCETVTESYMLAVEIIKRNFPDLFGENSRLAPIINRIKAMNKKKA